MSPSLIARAVRYTRDRGLKDLATRLGRELFSPSTVLGHKLRPAIRAPREALARLRGADDTFAAPNSLVAFYDCEILPITFDFCWFALAAELARRQRGFASVRFIIVAGKTDDSGPESSHYRSIVDAEERRQRTFNILLPIAGLLPTQDGIAFITSRRLASRLADTCSGRKFPEHYFPQFPGPDKPYAALVCDAARNHIEVPHLRAPAAALAYLKEWKQRVCGPRPLVTITLRHSAYLPLRNSNLEAWASIARCLNERGYCAAIVPDTSQTLKGPLPTFEGCVVMSEVSWNIALRAALYELAFVNLGVNCGPMALCWLNPSCRHITFKFMVEGEPATSAEFHQSVGIDPKDPFPFAHSFQRVFSDTDDADIILREFDRMCADIQMPDAYA